MRLNFRQGLVSYQKDLNGQPKYLIADTNTSFVTLVVSPTPLTITFAQGGSDYLATFDASVKQAWGPLLPGVDNWLYWEMDPITAEVRQGITTVAPVFNSLEPARIPDQCWFDASTNKMRVWQQQSMKWVERIRVFAGRAVKGSSRDLVMYTEGSQVNLITPSTPGYPMLDSQLRPLRTSLGEFLTTGTDVRIKNTIGTSGVLAIPTNAYIPVLAGEAIPPMSLVYFSAPDTVSLASSDPALITKKTPIGIIQTALAMNEVGVLTQVGEIVYDQWDWSGQIGKALYTDSSGHLTTIRPAGLMAYRVGFIKNKNTIIFGIDAETEPQVYQTAPTQMIVNGLAPIITTDSINPIGERVVSVSIQPAIAGYQDGYMTAAQAALIQDAANQFVTINQKILSLDANKADKVHTHTIAQVNGLQAALDSKFPLDGNFDNRYSLLTHNHDGRYAFERHTHPVTEVDGLTTRLATKLERTTGILPFTRIFQTVDQSGSMDIGNGDNLVQALGKKAEVVHTHTIAQVTGLQTALDGKANTIHTHTIGQVDGLQIALDGKANVVHTHQISQIDGLQSALNGKSDAGHTHTQSEIDGLDASLSSLSNLINNKTLSSLTDVAVASPQTKQALMWNGTQWQNLSPTFGIKIYSNETTSYFTNGITVKSTDGSIQVANSNKQIANGDNLTTVELSAALKTLTDVNITAGLAVNQMLTWDGTKWTNKPISVDNLGVSGLTDVKIVPPLNDKEYFGWDSDSGKWTNRQVDISEINGVVVGAAPVNSTFMFDGTNFTAREISLNDISEVQVGGAQTGQVLTYNGSRWVNVAPTTGITTLAGLSDVAISVPGNGQLLSWNGINWVNVAASTLQGLTLSQIIDVTVGSQQIGDALVWDGFTWKPTKQPNGLPNGGAAGQFLSKSSALDGAATWVAAPLGLPAGGSIGQILSKTSSSIDGAATWVNAPTAVPQGGSTGQILTKPNDNAASASWMPAPIGLPAGGTTGQILAKRSVVDGETEWVNAPKADGTWQVFNTAALAREAISAGQLVNGMWVDILKDEDKNGFRTLNSVVGGVLTFLQYAEIAAYVGFMPAEVVTNGQLGELAFKSALGITQVFRHRPVSQPGDMWTEYIGPGQTQQFFHDYDGNIRTRQLPDEWI